MIHKEACSLLGVGKGPHSATEIRKAFYKKCLTHHPDRGGLPRDFILITTARDLLLSAGGPKSGASSVSAMGLQALSYILKGIRSTAYRTVVIKAPLSFALECLVSPLLVEGVTYHVPLWHRQMEFKGRRESLIVRVELELPDGMTVNDDNTITLEKRTSLAELCDGESFSVGCAGLEATVRNDHVLVQKYQRLDLGPIGLPLINDEDILATKDRAHVYIELYIEK